MNADAIREIIGQYTKHGRKLRRVLLSAALKKELRAATGEFDAEIVESTNDGLWFSRRSRPNDEAWELRRLSGSPFALVVVIDDEADDSERENALRETEEQMFDSPQFSGH
jgi:hypothetical protein